LTDFVNVTPPTQTAVLAPLTAKLPMPSKRTRDSRYYEDRLRKEHPAIFADLRSGKLTSIRAASAAARLIHLPTRLDALRREWKKATTAERRAFAAWLKSLSGSAGSTPSKPIASPSGQLTPGVVAFLSGWLVKHRAKPGRIMREMGFSNYDYRLARGIAGDPLPNYVVSALEKWLAKAGYPT